MSFAAQLAARAEATTKRTSLSGGSSIGSPPQSQSSLSESIKNRVSASNSTTEQSTNNKQQRSTTSGWKPKQQQQKQKKNKKKKKLVPISPEASPIIDSSYRDVETRHIKKHQPQDVTNNNNSSIPAASTTSSMLPATTTEESKRMSFGSAIKAANKISSSRENSKDDIGEEAVKQSQSIPAERSNSTTTAYTKKLSSSSSEQRLSNTAQALDTQLNLSIENLQLQSSLHDIQTKYKALELQLNEKKKDKGIITTTTQTQNQNNLVYTRKSSDAMSSIGGASGWINAVSTKTGRGEEGQLLQRETSGISVESFVTHDELMEENVRLTQLILDIGQLEELEKLRRSGGVEDNITQQQPSSDKAKATIQQLQRELTRGNKNSKYTSEKDATIQRLQEKLAETQSELQDTTELKNAEIQVLRKQLDRAENLVQTQVHNAIHKIDEVPSSWSKEREGLRDEIRRLNVELSNLKGELLRANSADEEELADLAKYNQVSNNTSGTASPSSRNEQQLDSIDVTSLQSIIEMMRQTIEQNTREKKVLEERLEEEQTRSQMELQAFAKTLEGVDDLRQSAESMSREIRRIKVKGYRPTRSDLFGNANTLEGGGSNFGELTAAVEASDNMEDAIRLIENQNDKMEERRRMNLVVASSSVEEKKEKSINKKHYPGLSPIKDDDGDGFLSFWNRGDENEDDIAAAKKEKKRKSKKKKKHTGGGSVLTSFF